MIIPYVLQDKVIVLNIPSTLSHNMGETFSRSNVYKFLMTIWVIQAVVLKYQNFSDRDHWQIKEIYENNEANWGSVSEWGGCCAANDLHIDYDFTEFANWECKRRKYLIYQLWLSHLPEQIIAYGFAVCQVLWLLTVYSCYLGDLVLFAAWTTTSMPVWYLVLCPDRRRSG